MEFIEIIFLLLFFILKRLSSKHRNSLENADIWADIRVHRKKNLARKSLTLSVQCDNELFNLKISFITCKSRFYIRFTFVFHFWRIWRTARRRLVDGSSFPLVVNKAVSIDVWKKLRGVFSMWRYSWTQRETLGIFLFYGTVFFSERLCWDFLLLWNQHYVECLLYFKLSKDML